jgi:hypothetical protein
MRGQSQYNLLNAGPGCGVQVQFRFKPILELNFANTRSKSHLDQEFPTSVVFIFPVVSMFPFLRTCRTTSASELIGVGTKELECANVRRNPVPRLQPGFCRGRNVFGTSLADRQVNAAFSNVQCKYSLKSD